MTSIVSDTLLVIGQPPYAEVVAKSVALFTRWSAELGGDLAGWCTRCTDALATDVSCSRASMLKYEAVVLLPSATDVLVDVLLAIHLLRTQSCWEEQLVVVAPDSKFHRRIADANLTYDLRSKVRLCDIRGHIILPGPLCLAALLKTLHEIDASYVSQEDWRARVVQSSCLWALKRRAEDVRLLVEATREVEAYRIAELMLIDIASVDWQMAIPDVDRRHEVLKRVTELLGHFVSPVVLKSEDVSYVLDVARQLLAHSILSVNR